MNIVILNHSNLTIYEQIVNQIKDAIIAKEIRGGEPLPSIRTLARDLKVSVITTKRAYEELEKEGLVYSVTGKGSYVSEQNTDLLKEKKLQEIERQCSELIEECKKAELTKEDIIGMIDVLFD